jgi:two-component system sensor histidine kinase UhpB
MISRFGFSPEARQALEFTRMPEIIGAVETALYRVAQEAFTNAARHGQAETVTMELERAGQVLRGRIRDDGAGFDPAALNGTKTQGLGVAGMRARLIAVGGKLTITSSPGSGTSIEFEAPVES